jgi:hypothetical protein
MMKMKSIAQNCLNLLNSGVFQANPEHPGPALQAALHFLGLKVNFKGSVVGVVD